MASTVLISPNPPFAHSITVHNPFHPHQDRLISVIPGPVALRALVPETDQPILVLRNGEAQLRATWDRPVQYGDLIAIIVLPQGGGGGGSNPLRVVLMLAVLVYAPMLASNLAWAGVSAGSITSVAGFDAFVSVATAGITMAGMALVNAVIPPPKPTTAQQAASLAAPSPTYHLQAQGNMARLDQAIPVQYGRVCAYPDFAAQPYVEYAGNEQYLYQLLCLGMGEYDIEAVRIEDTPVANFAEIDYEVIAPGGVINKFPTHVVSSVEVSGQELAGSVAAPYSQSGTTITVTLAAHGYAVGRVLYLDVTSGTAVYGAYTIATVPSADTFTLTATSSVTTSGNVTVQHYVGGFVANAAGTQANTLSLDFVLSRGLYEAQSDGSLTELSLSVAIEARQINDQGVAVGSAGHWDVLGQRSYTAKTTTPQRYSERFTVTGGRYEVRVRRLDAKQTDTRFGHEILWGGLRAYLPETRLFGNVTLIAMRMRASNNLSAQASRKINVVCTRKLPVWSGSTWSEPVATRSIAWALADACRNTTYGAKLPDARLDLAGLHGLDGVWSSRGDEFNARFDSALNFWEAITKIAQAGRAKPYMLGGIIRFARDGAQSLPVAMFSMRNIVRGSFGVEYLLPSDDMADAVEVSYWDADVWATRRVTAKLADSNASKPTKIELFGVTSRQQAYREGLYQAASNRYRRRLVKFTTEMEGFIPAYGDLIAIQHDMPAWGQFAECTGWNAVTRTLTVSEPMSWSTGTHYVGLRNKAGGVDGPYSVSRGAADNELVLVTTPTLAPYAGADYERTHIAFGWGETWRQWAKVIAVRPRGLHQVEIEAINEDPSVHSADQGGTAPAVVTSQLTTRYTTPLIADLTLRSSTTDNSKALLTWTPAPGAETYQIEMAAGSNPYAANLVWTRVGETSANNFAVTALYGVQTLIRVRGVGLTAGPWVALFYGSSADYMWVSDAQAMWQANAAALMWRY